MQAVEVYEAVSCQAESIKNDELQHVETMSIGDAWRQGDIYIRRVADLPDAECVIGGNQLAPGTTQGSRHCVDAGVVEVRTYPDAGVLDGPHLKSSERFTVTHPEHGDVSLPAGTYHVTNQRAYADVLRRVRD